MPERFDAIVVGGGHNGLVTAAYLARGGMRTVVLERRERVGGAVATEEIAPGVKAPVAAHTIGRFDASILRDLGLAGHGLALIRPDVRAFAPQPDGSAVTLWADAERTSDELRKRSVQDAEAYPRLDGEVRAIASFLSYVQAARPPDITTLSLEDVLLGLKLGRALRGLGGGRKIRETLRLLPMAVADFVKEEFESEALQGLLSARGVQYAAMGPWSAGTAMNLLADSAGNRGGIAGQTVFARGGPGALSEALAGAARSFGAEVRCGVEVTAVRTQGSRATGVTLASGRELDAAVVASSADPKRTLLGLLDPVDVGPTLAWRAGNLRLPGVVAKVNLVLSGQPRFVAAGGDDTLLMGRIVIAPTIDYVERAFDASKYGRVSDHPYVEATIPTLTDRTLAPDGTHVLSALVQYVPYHLREGDRDAQRDRVADLVVATLERYAPGLGDIVVARHVLTPVELERDYGLTEGHPLHGEPALDQLFAWRPLLGQARYRLAVDGLYLCGSGAHPGGGVTGMPGRNAAREILSERRGRHPLL